MDGAMSRILIVEDDTPLRRVMGRILAREGHDVSLAADGRDALRFLAETTVDLVLTDLYMPGVDGVEMTIRLLADGSPVPIVAVSGGGFAEAEAVLARARGLGVAATLAKPFSPWELLRVVKRALGRDSPGGGGVVNGSTAAAWPPQEP